MNRILEIILLTIGVAAILILSYWLGQQAYSWMPPQGTEEAKHVDDLFSFLVTLGSLIFFGVVGTIAYAVLTCRANPQDYSEGHPSRGNGKLEFFWTIVPTVLVMWIACQSYNIYQELDIEGLSKIYNFSTSLGEQPAVAATVTQQKVQPVEKIQVIAKQWEWTFQYPTANLTTSELHLPLNHAVHLVLKSEDVLHGFYVPEFRFKQDIIPNHPLDFVFTPIKEGKYVLHDSQFSGTYFPLMEANVYVDSPDAYRQWLQTTANNPLTDSSNLAAAEYNQPAKQFFKTKWATVVPTQSTVNALQPNLTEPKL